MQQLVIAEETRPTRRRNIPADPVEFTTAELAIIEAGRKALSNWTDGCLGHYFQLYDAIMVFKRRAPNKFKFCDMLRENGFGAFTATQNGRNQLWAIQAIGAKRKEVIAWWKNQDEHRRMKYLRPTTIVVNCPLFPKKHSKQESAFQIALRQLPKLTREQLGQVGQRVLELYRERHGDPAELAAA